MTVSFRFFSFHLPTALILSSVCNTSTSSSLLAPTLRYTERIKEALNAHKAGKLDTALTLYETILFDSRKDKGLVPEQIARVHVNVGGIFYQQNQRDEATRHFEDALLCDSDFSEAHLNLAIVLYDDPTQLERAERHALSALVNCFR